MDKTANDEPTVGVKLMHAKATYTLERKGFDIADRRCSPLCGMKFQGTELGLITVGIVEKRPCLSSERWPVNQDAGGTSRVELGPAYEHKLLVAYRFVV